MIMWTGTILAVGWVLGAGELHPDLIFWAPGKGFLPLMVHHYQRPAWMLADLACMTLEG